MLVPALIAIIILMPPGPIYQHQPGNTKLKTSGADRRGKMPHENKEKFSYNAPFLEKASIPQSQLQEIPGQPWAAHLSKAGKT